MSPSSHPSSPGASTGASAAGVPAGMVRGMGALRCSPRFTAFSGCGSKDVRCKVPRWLVKGSDEMSGHDLTVEEVRES